MSLSPETQQLALWRSDFGREYTDRNDVERPARVEVWRHILDGIAVESALEVGCNIGWNLAYLRQLGVPDLWGVEPQRYAVERVHARWPDLAVVPGTAFALPFRDAWFDLTFTSGVLIHIAGDDLPRALDEIYRCSKRYIVAIEYDHPIEAPLPYRGHAGALWKRNHGAAWMARYPGLTRLKTGELGTFQGYDDCTFHLFEKA